MIPPMIPIFFTHCNQVGKLSLSISNCRINRAKRPKRKVIISWLRLLRIVSEITLKRLPSSIYRTLPKYSPVRLGVVTEKDTPEKMAFNDLKKPTGCTFCTDIFHFNASSDQFANIKTKTRIKLNTLASRKEAFILTHDSSRCGWSFICLKTE